MIFEQNKASYSFWCTVVAADSVHAAAFAVNAAAPPPHAATIARSTTEEVSQSVIHSVGASKQALRVKATILIWQKKILKVTTM